jgi:undecaprenyl-diphosphatase
MTEILEAADRSLTLLINHFGSPALDSLMILWSSRWIWLPFYFLLLVILYRKLTKEELLPVLIAIPLLIVSSDQTASGLFKPLFQRLRPCQDPDLLSLLIVPDGCGGQFGFASSHAANTMAIAVFFALLPARLQLKTVTAGLFFWAMVTGWSRIYLGMHFTGDILCGFGIGAFWASVIQMILRKRFVFR